MKKRIIALILATVAVVAMFAVPVSAKTDILVWDFEDTSSEDFTKGLYGKRNFIGGALNLTGPQSAENHMYLNADIEQLPSKYVFEFDVRCNFNMIEGNKYTFGLALKKPPLADDADLKEYGFSVPLQGNEKGEWYRYRIVVDEDNFTDYRSRGNTNEKYLFTYAGKKALDDAEYTALSYSPDAGNYVDEGTYMGRVKGKELFNYFIYTPTESNFHMGIKSNGDIAHMNTVNFDIDNVRFYTGLSFEKSSFELDGEPVSEVGDLTEGGVLTAKAEFALFAESENENTTVSSWLVVYGEDGLMHDCVFEEGVELSGTNPEVTASVDITEFSSDLKYVGFYIWNGMQPVVDAIEIK